MSEMWPLKTLGELCKIYNGNSIPVKIKKEKYMIQQEGLPYIGTKDVSFGSEIEYNTGVIIPPSDFEKFRIAPAECTFICAEGGSAGRKIGFTKQEVFFGNKLYAIVPLSELISKFVYYYCQSELFKNQFFALMSGMIGGVNQKKFKTIRIPVPPLEEQQRIVRILDETAQTIDALISIVGKELENLDELFDNRIKEIFSPKKDGWITSTLGEICDKITDGTHHTPKYIEQGIPFLSVKNLTKGFIDFSDTKYISKEEHERLIKRCKPMRDNILYTKVGTTGVAKVIDTDKEFSIFVSVALLILKPNIIKNLYVEQYLNSAYGREQAKKRTRGAANKNLVLRDIKQIEINYPSETSEQEKITNQIYVFQSHKEKFETLLTLKGEILNQLRQSIFQEAFTGKLTGGITA